MIILHVNNAKPRRSKITVQKIAELRITSASSPPLSPNIARPDFHPFGDLKDQFRKKGVPQRGRIILNALRISISDSSRRLVTGICRMDEETRGGLSQKW
jgi:hypothetical protein